jgi:hypothetical protein
LKIIILILAIIVFSSEAHSQCELEKERADKWNDRLKHKVTEWARENHRKAKQDFLDCLREPIDEPETSLSQNTDNEHSYLTVPSHNPKRYKPSNHMIVSNYTNFKGKKKIAWNAYFTESQECLSNSNDMPIFVACAKVRKQSLKQFNARWNEQTEELMPLLDSE